MPNSRNLVGTIFHAAFICAQPFQSGKNYLDSNFARPSVCAQPPQKMAKILLLSATPLFLGMRIQKEIVVDQADGAGQLGFF